MRIGRDHHFLLIESCPLEGGHAACRVEAAASASGVRFTASHDRLMLDASDSTLLRFADFESFKTGEFEIPFTESGWLRFQRDPHGDISVRYRIGSWRASAALEGEVMVEGEFAAGFCHEFGALLRSQR